MESGVEDFTAVSRDKPHLFWLHEIGLLFITVSHFQNQIL